MGSPELGTAVRTQQRGCLTFTQTNMTDIFAKFTADGDCSHEIKRCLLLGRKVIINLDSILKSIDITLPTKFCLVKAMVFPVVMYGYEKSEESESEVSQSCPTLCDPIDGSPPGSPAPGILQARTLEWVAISFSNA